MSVYTPSVQKDNGAGCLSADDNTTSIFYEKGITLSNDVLLPIQTKVSNYFIDGITTDLNFNIVSNDTLTLGATNGINLNSTLNMNTNPITNCASITNYGGDINIDAGSDFVSLTGNKIDLNGNNEGINLFASNDTILEDAINVKIQNQSNTDGFINFDLSTTYPVIELFDGNGNSYTTTYNGDLTISANNSSNYTTATLLTMKSFSSNVYLTAPSGKTYINKNGVGDGEIVASNFVGNLTGIASSATTASTASLATTITTTNTNANLTHYINFSDSSSTGNGSVQKTAGLSCNPSTNTITATTFAGNLTGTASSASAITLLTDNTSGTYYIPFSKNVAGSQRTLYVDDTTGPLSYNPSTSTLSATNFSGLLSTGGLVYLSTTQIAITGSASSTNLSFTSIFNSTYTNYRVVLNSLAQNTFTAYPSYALAGFLGTGVPTTGNLYGMELVSSAPSVLSAVYTAGATLSSAPLVFAVSSTPNKQVVIEIENVGFANTTANQVGLKCKSFYGNPGVSGYRDANITATSLNGATITGLTIQQASIGAGNNMTLQAVVYGYK